MGSRAGVYIGPGSKNITLRNVRSHRFIPDAWLLCLTGRCEAGIRKQYGDFGIRIDEPLEFWNLLSRAVVLRTRARLRSYLGWVRYTGRSYQGLGPLPGHPSLLKPSVPYGEEREFRMLWIPKDGYVIKEPQLSINEPALARFCTVL